MRRHFPAEYYVGNIERHPAASEQVTATFTDGTRDTADLTYWCRWTELDGATSVSTDVHYQYAGYVAIEDWSTKQILRQRLLLHRAICVLSISQFSHSPYVIPGEHESLEPGLRRFNWVWYVNYDQATELPPAF